jgi:MoaA/NifB/PqqE/SkfB family radical SAM enzyme
LDRNETAELLHRAIPFDSLDEPCEIVHLEISNRCNMACPYCYVQEKEGQELTTEQWKAILDDLAAYGIFQITFGGGEPTLREDLKELALHARRRGLNLCMTTNGLNLAELGPETLCLFNQVNVSYHGDEQIVWEALEHLEKHRVQRGINFVALKSYMPALPFIALTSNIFGAELLALTAKGVPDVIPAECVMAEARKLHQQGFKVAVDGLTCSRELPDYCMQKRRFCDVDSQGNVMPCSFVRTPIGNLLDKPFDEIWRSRGEQVPCPFVGGEEEESTCMPSTHS